MILELPILYYINQEQADLVNLGISGAETVVRPTTIIVSNYKTITIANQTDNEYSIFTIDEDEYMVALGYDKLKEIVKDAIKRPLWEPSKN